MSAPWITEFTHQSVVHLHLNTPRIRKCFEQLSETEIWQRPNSASNSMGNLVLHLCGNIRQYIISGLGKQPDDRIRDAEFTATGGLTKVELIQKLTDTLREADKIIMNCDETTLMTPIIVQGFKMSGIGIIVHVVEHYSYHTGQIAFWTKQLRNQDLGFYDGVDLNAKNTSL
jgi:uncharacterized damage-inducible protein DinB